jgi:protein CpxP
MNKLLGRTLVSACFLAVTTSAAYAQAPANMEARTAYGQGHQRADRAFSRPTERVEARLAYVKTALKITDAQQSHWDAYAEVARKNAQDMEQWIDAKRARAASSAERQRPNAIERLERAQSFHAELVTRINQLIAVEKPLYASLSPDQQKVADVVLNRGLRQMRRPLMHERGGFGRG